jgi:Tfp pilus assembly protein PilE
MEKAKSVFRKTGNESGLTLVEIVMILVIVGVLAAVAIPRFTDFKESASTAAEQNGTSESSAKAKQLICTTAPTTPGC